MGWRLPLLGLTRSDQVETPADFQADRAREWKRRLERESSESDCGGGGGEWKRAGYWTEESTGGGLGRGIREGGEKRRKGFGWLAQSRRPGPRA